jgi:hypothetical protein
MVGLISKQSMKKMRVAFGEQVLGQSNLQIAVARANADEALWAVRSLARFRQEFFK